MDGKGGPAISPTANLFGQCPAPSITTAGTGGLPSLLATSGVTPLTRDPHSQHFMVPATTGPLLLHSSPSTAVGGGWQGWVLSDNRGTDQSPSSPSFSESLLNLPWKQPKSSRGHDPHHQVSFRGFLSQLGLRLTGRASPELCSLLQRSSGVPAAP